MRIKNIAFAIVLSSMVLPVSANADTFNALYKKAINNIKSDKQCSKQELTFNTLRKIHDDKDKIQHYSTNFSNDIFVDFSQKNNKIGIDINVYPLLATPDDQLPAFCVISAFQAAIDPSKPIDKYMELVPELYSLAVESESHEYQSKNYEYSMYVDTKSTLQTLTFQIDQIN
ncbi:hypothetical protein Xmau_04323 [Xenorhabdus mauleonii]|uniref:Uncharacterized protein n=1 Tax=Xenorhabdus mauleonii TaxID=351675 RepID=A0A1I3XJZ8_9GAMM|nr:hypothetical protein [Xenorhabdus mauleonii]PHM36179.1 hypothetical protein Xmau_04323 [Xenorhabdus mauleonii]SFK19361.1 hypothetical protein SAMN05421680_13533 [Xenorhabdus mauleonii]